MSEGLVFLHSLGIGRESVCVCVGMGCAGGGGGGILKSILTPFSFLRPQDVFSEGLMQLPRKGRVHFPSTERAGYWEFLSPNYKVCLYE